MRNHVRIIKKATIGTWPEEKTTIGHEEKTMISKKQENNIKQNKKQKVYVLCSLEP
jgi:hypothetical protein